MEYRWWFLADDVSPIFKEKKGNTVPSGVFPVGVEVFKAPIQPFAVLNDRGCLVND